jgi:hypothetical protein
MILASLGGYGRKRRKSTVIYSTPRLDWSLGSIRSLHRPGSTEPTGPHRGARDQRKQFRRLGVPSVTLRSS